MKKIEKRNERIREFKRKYPNMSNAALGRIFKLTRERIRQILLKLANAEYLKHG